MQKEAAQELIGCHGHQFLFAAVGVILPAERHEAIGEVNDSMIGDGGTMGVAGQVMENVLRTAERRFGVYDPVLKEQRTKERTESTFVCERSKRSWERQLFPMKGFFQSGAELPTKHTTEHLQ